jgi:hypothetical protein
VDNEKRDRLMRWISMNLSNVIELCISSERQKEVHTEYHQFSHFFRLFFLPENGLGTHFVDGGWSSVVRISSQSHEMSNGFTRTLRRDSGMS